MRTIGWCAAAALLVAASSSFATVTVTFKVGGQSNVVAPAGGTFDVEVIINSDEPDFDGFMGGVGGVTMDIAASQAGKIAVSGVIGNSGSTGTGTRYNSPLWDSNTTTGLAFSPNALAAAAGAKLGTTPVGIFGSAVVNEDPSFDTSTLGWIKITVDPLTGPVSLLPMNFRAFNVIGDSLDSVVVSGVTFLPEPASALLLVAALPFLRRRSA